MELDKPRKNWEEYNEYVAGTRSDFEMLSNIGCNPDDIYGIEQTRKLALMIGYIDIVNADSFQTDIGRSCERERTERERMARRGTFD